MGNKKIFVFTIIFLVFLISFVSAGCPSEIVGYWKLDENPQTHLGYVADYSGNNNPGTFYSYEGTINKAVNGKVSNALSFDGINDYVEIPNAASLGPIEELSIEAWINPAANNNNVAVIVKKSDTTQANGYTLEGSSHITGQGNTFRFVVYNGKCPANAGIGIPAGWCSTGSTPSLTAGEWHHLVGTYNGSEIRLYLNGEIISDATAPVSGGIVLSLNKLMIGKDPSNPTAPNRFFKGKIDEVAIYNRSLTKEEVYQLYQNSSRGYDYCKSLCPCSSGPCCDGCYYLPAGADCGICAVCDGNGGGDENCVYDGTQDGDCGATECPNSCIIDINPYTWDYAEDVPNECVAKGQCLQKECSYEHECRDDDPYDGVNGIVCGAECDQDEDCEATECNYLDGCVGKDYYDYGDINNNCLDCACENNECREPTIYNNDARCTECQTDDDCSYLDYDYCDGSIIKNEEGICIDYECWVETVEIADCSERDGIMNECGLMEWVCSEEIGEVACIITNIEPKDELCLDSCDGDTMVDGSCDEVTYTCDYTREDCNDYNNDYCDGDLVKHGKYTCAISGGWVPSPPNEANDAHCVLDETIILEDCYYGCFEGYCMDCPDPNEDGFIDDIDLDIVDQNYGRIDCVEPDWCNGADVNRDGIVDILDLLTVELWYSEFCEGITCADEDGDGYYAVCGDCPIGDDCDDSDDSVYPGANELCDGKDNDCDSLTDEDFLGLGGVCSAGIGECEAIGNYICTEDGLGAECDAVAGEPADEICDNLLDDDCDGLIDLEDSDCADIECADEDGDGYDAISPGCPTGDDCDDNNADIWQILLGYLDYDQDGYGIGDLLEICSGHYLPLGYSINYEDCNDNDANTNPGADEICDNLLDDDCDGLIDLEDSDCIIECADNDGDGYGDEGCGGDDCDDSDDMIYPNAPELCDGKDNNCNGALGAGEVDNDGDGYMVCGGDCDDNDDTIYPRAKELKDGKDNDCDGSIDEGIIKSFIELSREKLFISKIRTNNLVYDEIKAGDLFFVNLRFENIGRQNTKYATIRVTIPELGISRMLGPFSGPKIDDVMSKGLYLEIPEDAKPGVYTIRISLSDLNGVRRTRHRDFRIIE